jgi:hypothetical protein
MWAIVENGVVGRVTRAAIDAYLDLRTLACERGTLHEMNERLRALRAKYPRREAWISAIRAANVGFEDEDNFPPALQ